MREGGGVTVVVVRFPGEVRPARPGSAGSVVVASAVGVVAYPGVRAGEGHWLSKAPVSVPFPLRPARLPVA